MSLEANKTLARRYFDEFLNEGKLCVADGDKVVQCFSSRGTCLGGFEGTKLSGRKVSIPGVDVFTIRNGKIAEVRCFWDTYSQMQQLDWVPLAAMNCA